MEFRLQDKPADHGHPVSDEQKIRKRRFPESLLRFQTVNGGVQYLIGLRWQDELKWVVYEKI